MHVTEQHLRSAHIFAGAGGDMCGFTLAGLKPTFAVEINSHRCRTLRLNFSACQVFEGPIQQMTLANYPSSEIPIFPCNHYVMVPHT
jgi:site-specific DNA-cytosine methylase